MNDDNFELAKGRADAVEVVSTPGEASAWRSRDVATTLCVEVTLRQRCAFE